MHDDDTRYQERGSTVESEMLLVLVATAVPWVIPVLAVGMLLFNYGQPWMTEWWSAWWWWPVTGWVWKHVRRFIRGGDQPEEEGES